MALLSVPQEAIVNSDSSATPEAQFLRHLLRLSEGQAIASRAEISGWLRELRQRSAYDVARLHLPSRQDEAWRFTDLDGLVTLDCIAPQPATVDAEAIAPYCLPEAQGAQVVFVNGIYSADLSDTSALPAGVFAGNLARLPLDDNYDAVKYIAHYEGTPDVFAALNATGCADVAIIWVGRPDVVVETPVQVLWVTFPQTQPMLIQPRSLFVAAPRSQVTVLEQYVSLEPAGTYFTNAITEVFVQESARLHHIRLQQEAQGAYHIATTLTRQAQESFYACTTSDRGAQLSRHNPQVWQKGAGTETQLTGLTLVADKQLADTHSLVSLHHPHGTTDHLHKCVAAESAQAVFSGKVIVPQAAQQTKAAQLNRNLLLSSKARINTQPQLQITADNVQCTHGATVSQLDADELFYLQSRGIDADRAKILLLRAFTSEVIERIPLASVREQLMQMVADYSHHSNS